MRACAGRRAPGRGAMRGLVAFTAGKNRRRAIALATVRCLSRYPRTGRGVFSFALEARRTETSQSYAEFVFMCDPEAAMFSETNARRYGRFETVRLISRGPLGRTCEARDVETGRRVLLKVCTRAVSENPAVAKVYEELRDSSAQQVDDPAILRIIEAGQAGGLYYLAFEYVEATPLSERMREGRAPLGEALGVIRQVAVGLRAMHQRGCTHGDVKPANILLGRDARGRPLVKLCLADLATNAAEAMVSIFGELAGTPKYMAPECIRGQEAGPRADIFSLGVVAYELLSGREPHPVTHALGYLQANCEQDPEPLVQLDTTISSEMSRVVQKMMAREPVRRYRNCQSLLDDLDRVGTRTTGDYSEVVPCGVDSAFATKTTPPSLARPRLGFWHGVGLAVGAAFVFVLGVFAAGGPRRWGWLLLPQADDASPVIRAEGQAPSRSPRKVGARKRAGPAPPGLNTPRAPVSGPLREIQAATALARDDVAQRRYEAALQRYRVLAEKYGNTEHAPRIRQQMSWVDFERALGLQRDGRYSAAAEAYRGIIQDYGDNPWLPSARKNRAICLCQLGKEMADQGKWAEAVDAFETAVGEAPASEGGKAAAQEIPEALCAWAEELLKDGEPDLAVRRLLKLSTEHRESPWAQKGQRRLPDALLAAAKKRLAAAQYPQAEQMLRDIVRNYQGSPASKDAARCLAETLAQWSQALLSDIKLSESLAKWHQLRRDFPDTRLPGAAEKDMNTLDRIVNQLRATAASAKGTAEPDRAALLLAWAEYLRGGGRGDEARAVQERLRTELPGTKEAASAREGLAQETYARAMAQFLEGKTDEATTALAGITAEYAGTKTATNADRVVKHIRNTPEGMAYVPAGEFLMGLSEEQRKALCEQHHMPESVAEFYFGKESPGHTVDLPAYYIDRFEVTNARYKPFVDTTGHAPPQSKAWDGQEIRPGFEQLPVTGVTWHDAAAYAQWAGKRLPTEAEWEKAARGPGARVYPWGDEFDAARCNVKAAAKGAPVKVGSFPDGASPFRCCDMVGNVQEWTADTFKPYPGSKAPAGASGNPDLKVVRGASWAEERAYLSTCVTRSSLPSDRAENTLGFRCTKTP